MQITVATPADAEAISAPVLAISAPFFLAPTREGAEPFLASVSEDAERGYLATARFRGHVARAGHPGRFTVNASLNAVPVYERFGFLRRGFAIKPLRVRILEATDADWARVPTLRSWSTQRTPADFRNSRIKADRALQRDPAYRPEFTNVPIVYQDHAITLDDEELALLHRHAQRSLHGEDDGLALRDIVFAWWEQQFLGRD